MIDEGLPQPARERLIRERLAPRPGDRHYLHLADLLVAMQEIATSEPVTVLDYGAGLSPYRSLFPHSQYRRADISSPPSVASGSNSANGRAAVYPDPDYIIRPDGRIAIESAAFDVILSTQVLEHVSDPDTYLAECFRLLRPGGRLFLTTHGSWHDHGDPHDFWRWTAAGLKYDLEETGFRVLTVQKLTTGPRATLWFMQMYLATYRPSRKTPLGLFLWLCRLVPRGWIHRLGDRLYRDCRVVAADVPGHRIYLAVAVCAQRPL